MRFLLPIYTGVLRGGGEGGGSILPKTYENKQETPREGTYVQSDFIARCVMPRIIEQGSGRKRERERERGRERGGEK